MSLVRTLCCNHLLYCWLYFIAYGDSCVFAYFAIDDDSIVVDFAIVACVISAVEAPANPTFYGVY